MDATRVLGERSSPSRRRPPAEAPPTLLWKVMARLDSYDRRRLLAKRWLAATTLAAATIAIRRRFRR
ncbi:hypothetical protein [Candidatus Poriferisocius sp.]|uniref:hypothetical protein n=1 Tax=Candidatus Poriferisocius sp. TaxID=3101276 RepID=UPI003B5A02E2